MKFDKKSLTRASIYIDDANMFFAQQQMGWFIDWQKVLQYFSEEYKIININFYSGLKEGDKKKEKYLRTLERKGFKTIIKPLKRIRLSKDNHIFKANVDVEITTDLIYDKTKYNTAILFSGDSDFDYVVKKLQRENKRIIVCASSRCLSRELKSTANKVVLFGQIRNLIELKIPPPK